MCTTHLSFCCQAVRAAQDEQLRLKDIEVNELKSVRMDLDRDYRDARTMAEKVRICNRTLFSLYMKNIMILIYPYSSFAGYIVCVR